MLSAREQEVHELTDQVNDVKDINRTLQDEVHHCRQKHSGTPRNENFKEVRNSLFEIERRWTTYCKLIKFSCHCDYVAKSQIACGAANALVLVERLHYLPHIGYLNSRIPIYRRMGVQDLDWNIVFDCYSYQSFLGKGLKYP